VNYVREIIPDYLATLTLNHTLSQSCAHGFVRRRMEAIRWVYIGVWSCELAASIAHGPFTLRLTANNLLDKRAILAPPTGRLPEQPDQ